VWECLDVAVVLVVDLVGLPIAAMLVRAKSGRLLLVGAWVAVVGLLVLGTLDYSECSTGGCPGQDAFNGVATVVLLAACAGFVLSLATVVRQRLRRRSVPTVGGGS
jgi:lysylphosphatidylglycerol synthetase-like protein (DUF2156 family)